MKIYKIYKITEASKYIGVSRKIYKREIKVDTNEKLVKGLKDNEIHGK